MSKRKETPDVLAEILGGAAIADMPQLAAPAKGAPTTVPASAKAVRKPVEKEAKPQTTGWEYRLVSLQDYKGWRPRFINGRELPDWTSGPLIHDYLSELGAQGWELAAASAGEHMYASGDHHQLYFKRRL